MSLSLYTGRHEEGKGAWREGGREAGKVEKTIRKVEREGGREESNGCRKERKETRMKGMRRGGGGEGCKMRE